MLLKVKSILVPLDFSEPSAKALDYAASFAQQFGAKLTLVHVVETVPTPDLYVFPLTVSNEDSVRLVRGQLQALCKARALGPKVLQRIVVRQGRAFHEISELARKTKADLIIVATHGYTGLKHALLGSTAERIVRHAPCPVLVVRQHERQFA